MKPRSFFSLLALLTLAGCNTFANSNPPVLPTVVLEGGDPETAPAFQGFGGVTASGNVVAAQEVQLAFALAGRVQTLNVNVGDQVEAGQVLIQLAGGEQLTAAVEAARMEVLNAQQALQDLQDTAALAAAQSQLAVAQAGADVAAARERLDDAEQRLKNLNYPDLDWYQEQVAHAQDALLTAQENTQIVDTGSLQTALQSARDLQDKLKERLDKVQAAVAACAACDPQGSFTVDGLPQTLADAQDNYNGAVNRVRELELQIAQAQRGNSQAIADAQEALDNAIRNQAAAGNGPKPLDVELAESQVAVAEADLALALAALAQAQAHDAQVRPGPDPDQLALAQARLAASEAQLSAAESALADLELQASFSGTVTQLNTHIDEWVTPGQPVLLLSDLSSLRVETTDLSERDIPQIALGQPATVYIKALNEQVPGRVSAIAPLADILGGDVVYKTTIDLDSAPAGLRPGMSVEVQFETGS